MYKRKPGPASSYQCRQAQDQEQIKDEKLRVVVGLPHSHLRRTSERRHHQRHRQRADQRCRRGQHTGEVAGYENAPYTVVKTYDVS